LDTPQQNGIAEWKNHHLLEVARSLMFEMKVDKSFWADAIMTTCYLINRMPSSVLKGATPLSSFSFGTLVSFTTLYIWLYLLYS